jgi:hypothetical protein
MTNVWKCHTKAQSKSMDLVQKGEFVLSREFVLMCFFAALSVVMLIYIGITNKHGLKKLFAIAISADFYSVVGNNIGIGMGFWGHPYRIFPDLFETSVVYDMLFFPATLVLYLVWMPRELIWKWIYSILWAATLSVMELWLEEGTKLIGYGRHWTFYKTGLMYLVTYFVFYWLYHWLFGYSPGSERAAKSRGYK